MINLLTNFEALNFKERQKYQKFVNFKIRIIFDWFTYILGQIYCLLFDNKN